MNILYLAYAFPPVNIVASHRALFQAVYMAKAGATVTVVCAEQSSKRDDLELLQYLDGVPGFTVHRIKPWGGKQGNAAKAFKPSAKSWLWVLRATKLVGRLLRTERFDVVYSTFGPKYPHLAGRLIHQLYDIPWVVEFRDPWHGGRREPTLMTRFGLSFERWLLKPARLIVTVSTGFSDILRSIHGNARQYEVVYNGFESSAVGRNAPLVPPTAGSEKSRFTVILVGTLYPFQFPSLEILLKGIQAVPTVTFRYFGSSTDNVNQLIDAHQLNERAVVHGLVPHEEVIQHMNHADVAFLPASTEFAGIIPVKFYDYLGTKTPVLMINGGGTELDGIIRATRSGTNVDTPEGVTEWLSRMVAAEVTYSFKGADFYTRQRQAEQLLTYLTDHVNNPGKTP